MPGDTLKIDAIVSAPLCYTSTSYETSNDLGGTLDFFGGSLPSDIYMFMVFMTPTIKELLVESIFGGYSSFAPRSEES